MKKINFQQSVQKARWLLTFFAILTIGIGQIWSADVQQYTYIYFDNTASNWDYSYTDFGISYNDNSTEKFNLYHMTAVTNTNKKLYVYYRTDGTYSGYWSVCVFGATSDWQGNGGTYDNMKQHGSNVSGKQTNYGFNANNYYYIKPSETGSTSSPASVSVGCFGNALSSLNYTIYLKAKISTDNGSTFAAANTPGALSATSYRFGTSYNACDVETEGSLSVGSASSSFTSGHAATTTLTAATSVTGYTFVGWCKDDATTPFTTDASIEVHPTASTEYYALYKVTQYAVNYGVYANTRHGSITLNTEDAVTETSSINLNHGTSVSFTATADDGYSVVGWYSDAECTSLLQTGGTTYNAGSLTAAKTVYVKFTGAMTLTARTGGQVSNDNLNWKSSDIVKNIRADVGAHMYAQASTGYTFHEWTTEATGTIEPNAVVGTYTPDSYDDIELTATFTETKYAVTVVNGTADVYEVGIATPVTVTADAAPSGKKFKNWTIEGTYTLQGGTTETSRAIEITAVSDVTLTAHYEDRAKKRVYFNNSSSWSKVYAYTWEAADATYKNAAWPGIEMSSTEVAGITYYYYEYYIDNDNEETPDDRTSQSRWDRVIFNNGDNPGVATSTKTNTLTLTDGHFYHLNEQIAEGSPSPEDWYVGGIWNSDEYWDYSHPILMNGETSGCAIVRDLHAQNQTFKIYCASANQWYKYTSLADVTSLLGVPLTLGSGDGNNTFTPTVAAAFGFTLNVSGANPVLTIRQLEDINCSVTVQAAAHGTITTGPSTIHEYVSTAIVAAPNAGYHFKNWTVDAAHSAYITFEDATDESTNVFATGSEASGAVITANFTNEGFVYLDLTNGPGDWGSEAYVTYFNSTGWDWNGTNGGLRVMNWLNDDVHNKQMTNIPGTRIFYFYTSRTPAGKILFVNKSHPDNNYTLYAMAASERGDFNVGQDNMFVIESSPRQTKHSTGYYSGYWMKYDEDTPGVKLCVYNGSSDHISGSPFTFTKDESGNFTTNVHLSGGTNYKIELLGDNGTYYKNNGTMNGPASNWVYRELNNYSGSINTTGDGIYTFTLACSNQLKLSSEYPLQAGDYRIVYNGKVTTDAGSALDHPSGSIAQWTSGTQTDKVSFFVTDETGSSMDWTLRIQSCSIDGSTVTWNDVAGKTGITFSDLDGETGVYTFDVTQTSASAITISNPQVYEGHYYIRTDKAKGGWEAYMTEPDNRMEYSDYAADHCDFNYYHCHYVLSGKNVKFTIANDYNPHITEELTTDDYVSNAYGNLSANANVRFMYDSRTNIISRAYIGGSNEDTYLNIVVPNSGYVYSSNESTDLSGADASDRKFEDMGNWVYQLDIKAYPGAEGKITAYYNSKTQYFIGTEEENQTIIGGTKGSTPYSLRAVYDFKSNNLVTAWRPQALTEADLAIKADIMLIREHQGDATQILLNSHTLSEVKTVYGVMQFNKWTLNNKSKEEGHAPLTGGAALSPYARDLFWISFPFDVNLRDVFGFGTYGTHWIIEYYDGKGRAKNGFWADSEPNWKFVTPAMRENGDDGKGYILQANTGYILALDLDMLTESSSVWDNTDDVSLYFPSSADIGTIQATSKTVAFTNQSEYKCNIGPRFDGGDDRRIKDSYWHCIGVPSFADASHAISSDEIDYEMDHPEGWTTTVPFVYTWNSTDNTLRVKTGDGEMTFAAMYSYLVQYSADEMVWTNVTNKASAVAARVIEMPDRKFNLALLLNDEEQDHTYVRLTDDANVSTAFEFNYDLCKEKNSGKGNIWTVTADTVEVAGNSQPHPLTTTVVPVGVKIAANGEYTFSMPEGTNGGDVWLIDNVNSSRTNLGLMDYTVNLTTGTYEGRFSLEFPVQNVVTEIENAANANANANANADVRKVFVGGRLYILRDGKAYDATGAQVR